MSEKVSPLAIWGAGGHAAVVTESLRIQGLSVSAYVECPSNNKLGNVGHASPTIRESDPLEAITKLTALGISWVALGFGNCEGRLRIGETILARGLNLVTVVHPTASVATGSTLGRGVFVGAGCVIDPSTDVGDFTIVNHRAVVCHDTTIGRAVHVCPGVTIAGHCTVGDAAWIGVGSILKDRITVGAKCFIGAGSNVVRDLADGVLAYGNPARASHQITTPPVRQRSVPDPL